VTTEIDKIRFVAVAPFSSRYILKNFAGSFKIDSLRDAVQSSNQSLQISFRISEISEFKSKLDYATFRKI